MQNTSQTSQRGRRNEAAALVGTHRLRSVSVIGGFLDGVRFDLAEGLNCIIGARGTGKTTALELVRYAIDAMPSHETNPAERKRIESLIQENLAGGRVQVAVETRDGLAYTISRAWGEHPIVLGADGDPTAISLKSSGLFKANVFSQNEVEDIADRPASQLTLIDGFQSEQIAQIDAELKRLLLALSSNASQIIPLQDKLARLEDELNTLPGVEEKLKEFAAAEGEDSDEVNQAHAQKALRDRERRVGEAAGEILQTAARRFATLSEEISHQASGLIGPDVTDGPNGSILEEIVNGVWECGQEVDRLIEQARARIAGEQEELARRVTALAAAHNEQELGFRAVIEKHKQAQSEAAERSQLERLRNELLAKKRNQDEMAEQLQAAEDTRQGLLATTSELRDRRFAIREEVARRLNAVLSPAIRVRILQYGNPECYQRLLENGLRGARIKHGLVAQKIVNDLWPTQLAEVVRCKDTAALIEKAGLNAGQAAKVVATLADAELLFVLETVELVDRPQIELKDGDTYKELSSLSTGQKCTAILPILLLDSENPLLVDQPEDNLDNAFIFGTIVESIRKIKLRRQLVFVTHNPNIPVLGDAERVFVLKSDGNCGRKVNEGSVEQCKDQIVALLEGGEEAFKQRKERYAY